MAAEDRFMREMVALLGRLGLVAVVVTLLTIPALFANDQASEDPEALTNALDAVMQYRLFWLRDSVSVFGACDAWKAVEARDDFPEGLSLADRLLEPNDPPCAPSESGEYWVQVRDISTHDEGAWVNLTVYSPVGWYDEDYNLEGSPERYRVLSVIQRNYRRR